MKAGVQKPVELESHHIITDLLETWSLSVDLLGFHRNTRQERKASNVTTYDPGRSNLSLFYGYSHSIFK